MSAATRLRPGMRCAAFGVGCLALLAALTASVLAAQPAPPPAGAAAPPAQPGAATPHDRIVATVEGRNIHLDELGDAVQHLPEALRKQPLEKLYPLLLRSAIDKAVILIEAQNANLDDDPTVRRRMNEAAETVLENEYLRRIVARKVTEAAIRQRYDSRYASLPGIEQRRFRIVMLKTRDEALRLRSALLHGEDFATLARQYSEDASSINGGEIGFVAREQLPPALATLVFDLPIGAVSPDPIAAGGGWGLIKVEQGRLAPVPPLAALHDEIRRQLEQQAIAEAIKGARDTMIVREYNIDGTLHVPRSPDGQATGAGN